MPPAPKRIEAPRFHGHRNWRGCHALVRRGVMRFLKEAGESLAGPAVGSLLFLAVFSLALGSASEPVPGVSLIEFLAPGIVILALSQSAFVYGAYPMLHDKMEGVIGDFLAAPLSPAEILAGYVVAASVNALLVGAVVLSLFWVFADIHIFNGWVAFGFAVAAAVLFALFGTLAGLWAQRWEHYSAAENFIALPLGFLSGAFFSVTALPQFGAALIHINPAFYTINGFRYGVTGYTETNLLLAAVLLCVLITGFWILVLRLIAVGYRLKP